MSTKKLVSKEIKSSKDLEKIKKDLNKIKQPFFHKVIKLDRIEYPELNLLNNLMKRNRLQEISVRECCETADDLARLLQAISSNPYVDTTDGNSLFRRVTDRLLSYVPESHREAAKLAISNQFRPKKKRNKNRYPVYQDDILSSEDQYCSEDEEMIDNCPTDSEDMDTSSAVDALTTPRFEGGYPIKNDIGKNNSRRWPMNYGEMYYTPLDDRQEKTFSRKSRAGIFTTTQSIRIRTKTLTHTKTLIFAGEQYTNQQLHSSSKEFDAHERQFPGYRISSGM
ncbi:uncharacterized protein LOC120332918 [Styela clava]